MEVYLISVVFFIIPGIQSTCGRRRACEPGTFGDNCENTCGHCKDYTECNQSDGECMDGCKPGFERPSCLRNCGNRTYGQGCSKKCGHCYGKEPCDPETGRCLNHGCEEGYRGILCDKGCRVGKYGLNCRHRCGHCYGNKTCGRKDGKCPNGCLPGWSPPRCDTCRPHHYGKNCNQTCGMCQDNDCEMLTGRCLQGCHDGWEGIKCEIRMTFGKTDKGNGMYFKLLIVSFAVSGVSICCGIVALCIHKYRQKKKTLDIECNLQGCQSLSNLSVITGTRYNKYTDNFEF